MDDQAGANRADGADNPASFNAFQHPGLDELLEDVEDALGRMTQSRLHPERGTSKEDRTILAEYWKQQLTEQLQHVANGLCSQSLQALLSQLNLMRVLPDSLLNHLPQRFLMVGLCSLSSSHGVDFRRILADHVGAATKSVEQSDNAQELLMDPRALLLEAMLHLAGCSPAVETCSGQPSLTHVVDLAVETCSGQPSLTRVVDLAGQLLASSAEAVVSRLSPHALWVAWLLDPPRLQHVVEEAAQQVVCHQPFHEMNAALAGPQLERLVSALKLQPLLYFPVRAQLLAYILSSGCHYRLWKLLEHLAAAAYQHPEAALGSAVVDPVRLLNPPELHTVARLLRCPPTFAGLHALTISIQLLASDPTDPGANMPPEPPQQPLWVLCLEHRSWLHFASGVCVGCNCGGCMRAPAPSGHPKQAVPNPCQSLQDLHIPVDIRESAAQCMAWMFSPHDSQRRARLCSTLATLAPSRPQDCGISGDRMWGWFRSAERACNKATIERESTLTTMLGTDMLDGEAEEINSPRSWLWFVELPLAFLHCPTLIQTHGRAAMEVICQYAMRQHGLQSQKLSQGVGSADDEGVQEVPPQHDALAVAAAILEVLRSVASRVTCSSPPAGCSSRDVPAGSTRQDDYNTALLQASGVASAVASCCDVAQQRLTFTHKKYQQDWVSHLQTVRDSLPSAS